MSIVPPHYPNETEAWDDMARMMEGKNMSATDAENLIPKEEMKVQEGDITVTAGKDGALDVKILHRFSFPIVTSIFTKRSKMKKLKTWWAGVVILLGNWRKS